MAERLIKSVPQCDHIIGYRECLTGAAESIAEFRETYYPNLVSDSGSVIRES